MCLRVRAFACVYAHVFGLSCVGPCVRVTDPCQCLRARLRVLRLRAFVRVVVRACAFRASLCSNIPARYSQDDWGVDPNLLAKLKEQYKKERKGKKNQKRKSRTPILPNTDQETKLDISLETRVQTGFSGNTLSCRASPRFDYTK